MTITTHNGYSTGKHAANMFFYTDFLSVIPFTRIIKQSKAPANAATCKWIHPSESGLLRLSAEIPHTIALTVVSSFFQIADFKSDTTLQ